MAFFTPQRDPGLYPYRQGLYFAFFNAMNWQIATATPTVLFMAYLGADSFETGLVYAWPLLLTPIQVFATVLLPRLGFKRLTLAGWGARSWFLVVPLGIALLAPAKPLPWMIPAMVAAMFFYSVSRSVGAAAITTWLQGLVPAEVRGRYWSTDQIMGGAASIGTLLLCAATFTWLPASTAFSLQYVFSIAGAWLAFRCLRALPDIERPTVMSLTTIRTETPRHLFGPGLFRPYLWLAVLFYVVTIPLVPFGAYYLKVAEGISPAVIMGCTIVQYTGVITGNWFMRSRIDRTGAKPFLRASFVLYALVAAGWLAGLQWRPVLLGLMPVLYFLLGAGAGIFTAANVSYLAKILPLAERALPVSLHGAMCFCLGGLAPIAWGLLLKGEGALPSVNLGAFQGFFVFTLAGALGLVLLVNRLKEDPGHVDPLLEGDWLFRPFRVVASLVKLSDPVRTPGQPPEPGQR
ncbi:Major Facilitator Superfamily protein [Lacunisphaera limnophila]|uniref:Major Facilitator Superfamily protein n=1 Tax=Lacunisphaera limnophila TaxID=1838286 RepID=A0A1D8AXQ3_9BACT|nr:MFS transporter [Lacunisphaera limnophila]AOS45661.1 Major Facilitator Superfamily protein [Lacunisphaera limnophila]